MKFIELIILTIGLLSIIFIVISLTALLIKALLNLYFDKIDGIDRRLK